MTGTCKHNARAGMGKARADSCQGMRAIIFLRTKGNARTKGTCKQGHGTFKQGQDMRTAQHTKDFVNVVLCQHQLRCRTNSTGRHAKPGARHAYWACNGSWACTPSAMALGVLLSLSLVSCQTVSASALHQACLQLATGPISCPSVL